MNKYTVRPVYDSVEIFAESEERAIEIATEIFDGDARTHLNHGFSMIDTEVELEEENVDEEETSPY